MRAVIQPATLPKPQSHQAAAGFRAEWVAPEVQALPPKRSWRDFLRQSSSLFYSALLHTAILVALGLIAVKHRGEGQSDLVVHANSRIATDQNTPFETTEVRSQTPETQSESIAAASLAHSSIASPEASPTTLSPDALVAAALGSGIQVAKLDSYENMVSAFAPPPPMFSKSSLDGRSQENRTKLALSLGGNLKSEKAVEAALVWLAKHQHRDGGWSTYFIEPTSPCQGQCSHGSVEHLDAKRPAATGLALLSFLGAGYTHQDGKYKDEVYRGLMYLIDHIKIDPPDQLDQRYPGQFSAAHSRHQMYEQGIATLALCEAYQMTHDPILKNTCQRAIQFISEAQHYDGSWGYFPRTPGDLSIVGWQMMSLKSAHSSELPVNGGRIQRIDRFLDTQQSEGGAKYGYRGSRPSPSMTAVGLLMRLYRGWPKSDPRMIRGAAYLFENGPSRTDLYLDYYATQALFQLNSPFWPKWNTQLRDYLISSQSLIGHEAGSWYFDDEDRAAANAKGGRLYCTALATMTLEVYYRYMPIYLDVREQPFNF